MGEGRSDFVRACDRDEGAAMNWGNVRFWVVLILVVLLIVFVLIPLWQECLSYPSIADMPPKCILLK